MMRRTEMQQLQLQEQRRMEEAGGRRAAVIGGHIGVGSSDAATISSGSLAAAGEDVWRRSQASVLAMPNETLAQQVKGVEVEATEVKDMRKVVRAKLKSLSFGGAAVARQGTSSALWFEASPSWPVENIHTTQLVR